MPQKTQNFSMYLQNDGRAGPPFICLTLPCMRVPHLCGFQMGGNLTIYLPRLFLVGRSSRTCARPRFNSAERSVSGVATWTGSPDSRPSQRFSSAGDVVTKRPSRLTGIPWCAQRWATETGCPRKEAICCHPFSCSDSFCAGAGCGLVFEFGFVLRRDTA